MGAQEISGAEMTLRDVLRAQGLVGGKLKKAFGAGKIFLGGIPTSDGGRLVDPDAVEFRENAPRLTPGRDLVIVHKDIHLAVVWKPAGLLSVPAGKAGGHKSVIGAAKTILGQALPVHRLDEETSGLMMVARTRMAQISLKEQLEAHDVERGYLAIVSGKMRTGSFTKDTVLVRNRGDRLRGSRPQDEEEEVQEGKRAITHFKVLATLGGRATLIGARLETGRTHQVRIHLAETRHPVLGDMLYANARARNAAPRLALHAALLGFTHPQTGKAMRFEAPLADDLEQLRRFLIRGPHRD